MVAKWGEIDGEHGGRRLGMMDEWKEAEKDRQEVKGRREEGSRQCRGGLGHTEPPAGVPLCCRNTPRGSQTNTRARASSPRQVRVHTGVHKPTVDTYTHTFRQRYLYTHTCTHTHTHAHTHTQSSPHVPITPARANWWKWIKIISSLISIHPFLCPLSPSVTPSSFFPLYLLCLLPSMCSLTFPLPHFVASFFFFSPSSCSSRSTSDSALQWPEQ